MAIIAVIFIRPSTLRLHVIRTGLGEALRVTADNSKAGISSSPA